MIKILNLRLVILLEYQKIKTFLQKAMFEVGLKKFLWFKNLKALCRGGILLVILKAKKLLERFTKKNCKKIKGNQKEFRVEKWIRRNSDKLYVKWKGYYVSFND